MAKKKRAAKGLKSPQSPMGVATVAANGAAPKNAPVPEVLDKEVLESAPKVELSKAAPAPIENFNLEQTWLYGSLAIIIGAVALRLLWLTLKPYHHDEGVNGFFMTALFRDGVYKYDPANYHGPSLYYFSLISTYIFGLNDFALRFVTVIFGLLTVFLVFSLRRYLGTIGTLAAAAFVALSPGMVFFSRYFIHEMLLVYFCFAAAVAVLKYLEGERPGKITTAAMAITTFVCLLPIALHAATSLAGGDQIYLYVARFTFSLAAIGATYFAVRELLKWDEGRPMNLLLAAAATAMTFTTKETSFITLGTMLIALGCIWVWLKFAAPQIKVQNSTSLQEPLELSWKTLQARLDQSQNAPALLFLCVLVFAYVNIIFFSSFFSNEKGITDAFEAYNVWTKTGTKDHAINGRWAYLTWLLAIEAPILLLGAVGALIAFQKSKHRFAMFAALWAFGLFAAYTIIPYKTPWLAINFVLPLALIAGYGINELINSKEPLQRIVATVFAGLAGLVLAYQSVQLNFVRYDDEAIPYVYVHSKRSMNEMLGEIQGFAERAGTGNQTSIVITAPENWPLPWSLHDYKRVGYHGTMVRDPDAELIIGSSQQAAELDSNYAATHRLVGTYTLRSGIELMLYARKNIPAS